MPGRSVRLLSLAPYRVLPATTGGHWGIVSMHDALGKLCQDHVLGVMDNGSAESYAFEMHKVFYSSWHRYIPQQGLSVALGIAKRYDATHIFCDHPYMAPLAISLSRKLRIPWVLRSHNIEAARFRHLGKWWWRIFRWYEQLAMKSAHAIFFITPEDCEQAVAQYELRPDKCFLAPYGTNLSAPPEGHEAARKVISSQLHLNESVPWLYFLGVHSYPPNAQAVAHILKEMLPRLKEASVQCEIIIAGKGLPQDLQDAISGREGICYAGFIEDLDTFLKSCDIMLNPLTTGGGIKTKAVEALAYNKVVVSTLNGAAGILPEICGGNLIVTADGDWDAYTEAVIDGIKRKPDIPAAFYEGYNWDAIARFVLLTLADIKYPS
jgi:glycosyltransferase involved in cell wall biosynthesis